MKTFIDAFLVAGPSEVLFHDDETDSDQMRYEKELRARVVRRDVENPKRFRGLDTPSLCGRPWHYYYAYGNVFVDYSSFYSVLTVISLDACTIVHSERRCEKTFVLWTYAAATVWCNCQKVAEIDVPVYKPMIKRTFTVPLVQGDNELYVFVQNLGVRDSRTLFGIEVADSEGLSWHVPEHEGRARYQETVNWLSSIRLEGRGLSFSSPAPAGARLGYDSHSPDYALVKTRKTWHDICGCLSYESEPGNPYLVMEVSVGGQKLTRSFEIVEMVGPVYGGETSFEGNCHRMLSVIASAAGLTRGDKFGFYIQSILARKAIGRDDPHDKAYFLETLQQISDRYDCSDFLVSGVIRYIMNYEVDPETKTRIDQVLLNYRYWMTMEGSDAMCFWSENHSLLFYSCAMIVGKMYPDLYFPRAKMRGAQLSEFGRKLTLEWFDDVDEYGFEEFLSTVYMNVTFACLLNIIDYADEEISGRATRTVDKMLRMLASHTFKGAVIAPMGRVYRGVIYPCRQEAQALMNLVNPSVPTSFGEGWLSYYATSKYKIPADVVSLMDKELNVSYSTGNAMVKLCKTHSYCLTSVQSPRTDAFSRWRNCTLKQTNPVRGASHWYTKSFNERFHGTTYFQPGVFGYQQHMWMAALSSEAVAFVNHPGSSCDESSMRPGYWYGNGVMPAVRQEQELLGAIYVIPDIHPIQFTHVFLPQCKFDYVTRSSHWVFARKADGCLALWSSGDLIRYDDELSNCELRVYGGKCAYLCLVGSTEDYGSFDGFRDKAISLSPLFDVANDELMVSGKSFLSYQAACDETQYV